MNLISDQFQVKACLHGMHELIPLKLCSYSAVDTVARITLQKILLPISMN